MDYDERMAILIQVVQGAPGAISSPMELASLSAATSSAGIRNLLWSRVYPPRLGAWNPCRRACRE